MRDVVGGPGTRAVVGLLTAVPLPVVGYAVSASALVQAPLLLGPRAGIARRREIVLLLVAVALAVTALVVSAWVHGTGFENASLLSWCALGVAVAACARLVGRVDDGVALLTWASVGVVLYQLLVGFENTRGTFEHLWKYGIAIPLMFLTVVVASRRSARRWTVLALVVFGSVSMVLGFRSNAVVCLATAVVVVARSLHGGRRQALGFLVPAGLMLWALATWLPALIARGAFGEAVRARTLSQGEGSGSLLLAGRVEPPLSFAVISERPLLGWGSVDSVPFGVVSRAAEIAHSLGLRDPAAFMPFWIRDDGRVSLHSVLFEGWAAGGLLVAVPAVVLLVVFVRGILAASGRWMPVVVVVGIQGCWDVVFSTWGYARPSMLALGFLVSCAAIARRPAEPPAEPTSAPVTATAATAGDRP